MEEESKVLDNYKVIEDCLCIRMPEEYTKYPDIITYTEFRDKTPNGILGDATIGSRDKGEAIVRKCVDKIAAFMMSEFNS